MIAVYWDFDGTLARHDFPTWSCCALWALREAAPSAAVTLEQIRPLMQTGFPWDEWAEDHTAHVGPAWWAHMERYFTRIYEALGVDERTALRAAKGIRAWILRLDNYPLYEDALGTLSALRLAGCRQVLLSNNYPELPETAKALGLTDWLDGVVVSGLAGYDKPRRELFEQAMALCPDADAHVMVGDNPIADVAGAKAVGIRAVLVHRGFHPDADACFDTLSDTIPWILALSRKNRAR